MKYLAALTFFFFLKSLTSAGQTAGDSSVIKNKAATESKPFFETLVIFKGGGQIRGELIEWKQGEHVVIKTYNGLQLLFPETSIDRIKQFRYGGPPVIKDRKKNDFREIGWYGALHFGIMPTNSSGWDGQGRKLLETFTFSASAGYQLSRFTGIGFGFGVDKYGNFAEMTMLPVFIEARSYFLRKARSPYLHLMLGRGYALDVNDTDGSLGPVSDKYGGLFVAPSLGVRLGGRESGNLTVDFGARFQKCGFESDGFGSSLTKDLNYRRYTLRVGVLF